MDWLSLITTLITTFLPLLIDKGVGTNKFALQRRQVFYAKLAEAAAATEPIVAAVAFEASELCGCLADCPTKEAQEQLFAATNDGFKKALQGAPA